MFIALGLFTNPRARGTWLWKCPPQVAVHIRLINSSQYISNYSTLVVILETVIIYLFV